MATDTTRERAALQALITQFLANSQTAAANATRLFMNQTYPPPAVPATLDLSEGVRGLWAPTVVELRQAGRSVFVTRTDLATLASFDATVDVNGHAP